MLRSLVEIRGARDWSFIASQLEGRKAKQCRERWHNHLKEGVTKQEWSEWEEWVLVLGVQAFGNRWSSISRFLPGRPENTIKNHWNCKMIPKKGALFDKLDLLVLTNFKKDPSMSETELTLL